MASRCFDGRIDVALIGSKRARLGHGAFSRQQVGQDFMRADDLYPILLQMRHNGAQ